jgi:hypothetical protein
MGLFVPPRGAQPESAAGGLAGVSGITTGRGPLAHSIRNDRHPFWDTPLLLSEKSL